MVVTGSFTVLFEPPYWIGLYERVDEGRYEVCKIVFGPEPKDYQVYDFLLKNWSQLRFSPSMKAAAVVEKRVNPKRQQRLIRKQMEQKGIETKAQQALRLQQEQKKLERKTHTRKQREEEKQRAFEQRQKKRKEKHRGH